MFHRELNGELRGELHREQHGLQARTLTNIRRSSAMQERNVDLLAAEVDAVESRELPKIEIASGTNQCERFMSQTY